MTDHTDTFDIVVVAARALVDGEFVAAEIGIRDGVIVTIEAAGAGLVGDERIEVGADEVLIPGLVDTHVHINEPGRTEWEGFVTATRAASAGGVTTLLDMPLNSIPPTVDLDALAVKQDAARGSVSVDVGFWGGAIPSSLGHLEELWDAGVFGFKAFLAPSGVDEFPHLDRGQLWQAMEEIAGFGGLLIVHCEDPAVLERFAADGSTAYLPFEESRPPEAELDAIQAVIDGIRATGARAHILHLSTAAALPMIAAAKAEGLPLTVETCPHYLTLDDARIPDGGTQYKCCPPIRSLGNQDALWAGLLDGTIDFVVTDHSPSTPSMKFAGDGDFQTAWGGIAGLQLGLSAVWTEAARRGVPLARVVEWMSGATSAFAGLSDRGAIAMGRRADLAIFAPDETFTVVAAELEHRNPVSAYDGHDLRGRVRRTLLAGAPTLLTRPPA